MKPTFKTLPGWLLLLPLLPLAVHASESELASSEAPPNIVVILVDDMGWSDIGSYGAEIDTPNLDRLATNGLRFTQFYNTSKCSPSRAALLTGLYAQQSGMGLQPLSMKNSTTLAEVLRGSGYRTLMVGKHHGTDNPVDFGFDRYSGLRDGASNHFNPGEQREGEPAPAHKRDWRRTFCFDADCVSPYTPDKGYYSTDTYTDWALGYLEEYRYEDRPFFLYIAYQAPHDPLQVWEDQVDKYRDTYRVGYEVIRSARYERQLASGLIDERYALTPPTHRPWASLTPEQQDDQSLRMAIYAAMVDRVDQNVGRLIGFLEDTDQLDNTLILFMSDNGSSAEASGRARGEGDYWSVSRWVSLGEDWANVGNTPFRFYKNFNHRGGINTPLIAHWPAVVDGGSRTTDFAGHFIDLMPTLVGIVNAEYPSDVGGKAIPPMEGESLLPVLQGDTERERQRPLFWKWRNARAVQMGRWKLVSSRNDDEFAPWELYDLDADKSEANNLVDAHPDLVDALSLAFDQWMIRVGADRTYDPATDEG